MRYNETKFFHFGCVVDLPVMIEDATIVKAYGKWTTQKPRPHDPEYHQSVKDGFIFCYLGGDIPRDHYLMVKPSLTLLAYWKEKIGYPLSSLSATKMEKGSHAEGCYNFTASENETGITSYSCGYLTAEVFENFVNKLIERMP